MTRLFLQKNPNDIDEEQHIDSIFHKERRINEDGLEQRMIVTYSVKYRNYQQNIRTEQISRAQKLLNENPQKNIMHFFFIKTSTRKAGVFKALRVLFTF